MRRPTLGHVTLLSVLVSVTLSSSALRAEPPTPPPPTLSCLDRGVTDPAADRVQFWADNATRLAMLQKVRRLGDERGPVRSLLAIEIGLAGSRNIYNSLWLVETQAGVQSFVVETPEAAGSAPAFSEREVEAARYALLWEELLELGLWRTPSDPLTVGLRADMPVFYATFCREGRLHRIRIENPPLPTWGKDDTFEQARRRHDKKVREFMLRPRDRAIEVLRLIQAF
jgi:hypothetical protein